MEQNKILAPFGWGKLKSNTHYASIDNEIHPLRPALDLVYYKYRWRPIQKDDTGATYIEYPNAIVFFEIKKFDKA